jgi:hypothetical protein
MSGFIAAEAGHIVNVIPPIDISAGVDGDRFSMSKYRHASIIVQVGVSAAAFTKIILYKCSAAAGGTATAIAHYIYKQETDAGDVLGVRTAVTTAGTTPSANNNIFYVIELEDTELSDGYEWVQVSLTNGVNSVIASCVAILSGPRYGREASPTVLA